MRIIPGKDIAPQNRAKIEAWAARRLPPLRVAEAEWDDDEERLKLRD